jgi:hypothetical protein
VGVLNACASVVALKEGRYIHQQIVEYGWDSDIFVANSLGALRMLGECSTRCHLEMWSLGPP